MGTFLDTTEKKIKGSQEEKASKVVKEITVIECHRVTRVANKISIWSLR